MSRTLRVVLLVPLLAASLLAAKTTNGGVTYLEGPLSEAQFGRPLAVGEFTGTPGLDAVVLDAGEPVLLIRPEVFRTALRTGVTAHGFARLPATSGQDRDSIVTIGDDGVRTVRLAAESGFVVVSHPALASWAGGRHVVVGRFGSEGTGDIAALGPTGTTSVHVARSDGQEGFLAVEPFHAMAPTHELVVVDFDGDHVDELAVSTDLGVELYDRHGQFISSSPWTGSPLHLTRLPAPYVDDVNAQLPDRMAAIATLGSGNQWLSVFDIAGTEGPYLLGSLGAISSAAGDLDGDGDLEMVLGVNQSKSVKVLWGRVDEEGVTFNPTDHLTSWAYGDGTRQAGWFDGGVGVGDFDHDGDGDVIAPVQGNHPNGSVYSTVEVVTNSGSVNESLLRPSIQSSTITSHPTGEVPTRFDLTFQPLDQLIEAPGDGSVLLSITIWEGDALEAVTPGMAAIAPALIPVPVAGMTDEQRTYSFAKPDNGQPNPVLSFVCRQVAFDAAGNAVGRGPALTAIHGNEATYEVLQTLSGKTAQVVTHANAGNGGSSVPGGGVVVGPRPPGFDDDERPDEDEPTTNGQG